LNFIQVNLEQNEDSFKYKTMNDCLMFCIAN